LVQNTPLCRNVQASYSAKGRNRELQKELLTAAASPEQYREVQEAASRLLSGLSTCDDFLEVFQNGYGTASDAVVLLNKLVDLIPDADLQQRLLSCAGMHSPSQTRATDGKAVTEASGTPSAAVGDGIPGDAVDVASGKAVLYWIRQDFRLHDNPALHDAIQIARKCDSRVVCAYIHSPGALHCMSGWHESCT
jgi:hypothetical protein